MPYPDNRHRLTGMLKQAGIVALYAALAHIDHLYFESRAVVSIFEPACGLALAILLIGGRRYAWGIFLGSLLANVISNGPLWAAGVTAAGNTLEALAAAWLLTRSGSFDLRLRSLRSYLLLVLAGSIGGTICALTETTVLLVSGSQAPASYVVTLAHRWMGEALGVTLITPLILVWWRTKKDWLEAKWISEAILLLGVTFMAGQIIFLGWFHDSIASLARGAWMFLLVTWVALRLGTHGTVIAVLMMAIHALWGAHNGIGYFANDIAKTQLVNYWLYMFVLSVNGMALATYLDERARAEAALRESEASMRAILDNSPYMAWLKDVRGRYVKANRKYLDYVRMRSPQQLIGKTDFDIWPAGLAKKYHNDDVEVLALRHQKHVEEPSLDEGRTRWVETFKIPIIDENGKALGTAGFSQDITERRTVEEVLHQSEMKFRTLYDSARDALILLDGEGFLDCNKAALDLFGCATQKEFRSKYPADLSPAVQPCGTDSVLLAERYVAIAMDNGSHKFEWVHRRADTGKDFSAEVLLSSMELDGRTVLQAVIRDITGRKQVEQDLAESESRFREIFNAVGDAIFIHDAETGRIIDVNRRMLEMYRFTREEALACGPADLSAGTPPYSSAEAIEKVHLARTEGPQTFDWLARASDGHLFRVEVNLRSALIGGQQRILAVVRDVSGYKREEPHSH